MSNQPKDKKKDTDKKKSPLKTDPETLHTTDPQENMEGPVSSIIQNIKEGGEANDNESKEEADRKKDKNTQPHRRIHTIISDEAVQRQAKKYLPCLF